VVIESTPTMKLRMCYSCCHTTAGSWLAVFMLYNSTLLTKLESYILFILLFRYC